MQSIDDIRKESWKSALICRGTAHIFSKRARSYEIKMSFLQFVGLVIPLVVGATGMSYGLEFKILPYLIAVGSALLIIQLVMSLWALVAKWDSALAYALESKIHNIQLADSFEKIGKWEWDESECRRRFFECETMFKTRSELDERISISDTEKRVGMRYGLYKYQRECATCKLIPSSMIPTDCKTCGH